ncbi:hypothetical protein EVAR_85503_1 [Eumeta japonica]|uniref:Uncharacterized protein n=1 Tax=Eumeta variegata TaxID=151549 RepID=A0A4C1VF21_EUMVA|nr:hypothetical protein EVAR_85503_1 [Eumeta japonica]
MSLEEKCENMMNAVTESRVVYGKMCVDYNKKTTLVENKILQLKLNTIADNPFKPKQKLPHIDNGEALKDSKEFIKEIEHRMKRVERLQEKVRQTQEIVEQLQNKNLVLKDKKPLTAEALLARAKSRKK